MDNRLTQFRQDVTEARNVVFCVRCGSTYVDQHLSHQLKCSNCDNISIWDSDRSSIARRGEEHDVVAAFRSSAKPIHADDGDWYKLILLSLLPLIHKLPDMSTVYAESGPKIQREEFLELIASRQEARTRVDAVVENLIRREDSIED